ncbi:MAG: DUF4390 domain-containing protein [Magnetococcales bacterium]|nr:DUF4390 domain-containing protein [Magnetococcales bacterium]
MPSPCDRSLAHFIIRRPAVTWIVLLTILVAGCGREPQPTPPNAIQEATPFLQGEKLFAKASLTPAFLTRIVQQLKQGEPLLATYRSRILRRHDWLPDLLLLDKEIQRHIRMRLITERYEMREENTGLVHYTSDENEAQNFFGNPRFILLHGRFRPLPHTRYQLETRVSLTHEGMSRMFRFLDRWLALNQPMDFIHLSELP